ncbi:hypothetical protein KSS87_019600 [Heliosperma pusillum]|nr:hypothetical protein KSS87_019600 [Heliosperma pusillum]
MEQMNGSRIHGLDSFLLVNPKDSDSVTKSWLQEILNLYTKELPGMNYAANTGKQSPFLQRCVSSGKFCTLLLSEKSVETSYKIPSLSLKGCMQGVGRLLYMELRKRLQDVGIGTILCWGDKDSEGFWQKQGFVSIAEVGTKGRARRLPIKADIRRALCFPGGSTLMISYLHKNLHGVEPRLIQLRLESAEKTTSSDKFYSLAGTREASSLQTLVAERSPGQQNSQLELNAFLESNSLQNSHRIVTRDNIDADMAGDVVSVRVPVKQISPTNKGEAKRRIWETSSCSFNSKRVKATHTADCQSHPDTVLALNNDQKYDSVSNQSLLGVEENIIVMKNRHVDALMACAESQAIRKNVQIMLMDIADGPKKAYLVKTIEDLGGSVAADGSVCTHVLTGKARRTLNFCTALCAGAWILSPHWLKESSREGRFVDEVPFILKDEEYLTKFRVDLKDAVFRARENPRGLLDGYSICLTTQVHPPIKMLSAIVRSAGGVVNVGLGEVVEQSRTIFIASEEDMEEASLAVKSGIRTFSSDWFMTCIMKQELDLDAPQFVESL